MWKGFCFFFKKPGEALRSSSKENWGQRGVYSFPQYEGKILFPSDTAKIQKKQTVKKSNEEQIRRKDEGKVQIFDTTEIESRT